MTSSKRYIGLAVGLAFTALVVGLLVYGNFFASSSHETMFVWDQRPVLHVCDTVPDWAQPGSPSFDKATDWWEEHGWAFDNIEVGPCSNLCSTTDDKGEPIEVVCNPGKVTLDLMDQWWSEEHAGVCRFPTKLRESHLVTGKDWTTILVPNVVLGSDDIEAPLLPADVEALVLAHEIGHCLVGLDHNEGPALGGGCRLNPKTGALMNPSIYKAGWVDEAIPLPPEEWNP